MICRFCGFFWYFVVKCLDSWENLLKVYIIEEEFLVEYVVLFIGFYKNEVSLFGIEVWNCVVFDSVCSSIVCGKIWLESYLSLLKESECEEIVRCEGYKIFKFGGGIRLKFEGEYELFMCLVGKFVIVKIDVVDLDIFLFFFRMIMKKVGVKLDLEKDIVVILG